MGTGQAIQLQVESGLETENVGGKISIRESLEANCQRQITRAGLEKSMVFLINHQFSPQIIGKNSKTAEY